MTTLFEVRGVGLMGRANHCEVCADVLKVNEEVICAECAKQTDPEEE